MKIAIVGCRGIPNTYGGFEQFAEYLSVGLVQKGHNVVVFNSHDHPYREDSYLGVEIARAYDPGQYIGSASQFIYDYLGIRGARRLRPDIILLLGYGSSALPLMLSRTGSSLVITNMDGMEWMRAKWSRPVKAFFKWSERLAVKHSDHLVADSTAIQDYLTRTYGARSAFIPYGANVFENPDVSALDAYDLKKNEYYLLIARFEPENNIKAVLEGFRASRTTIPLVLVGSYGTKHGKSLYEEFGGHKNVRFLGGVFDFQALNSLRYLSLLYFHGHSVGGTNPALLEAMAASANIAAHDNVFNRSVLGENAVYFKGPEDVRGIIENISELNGKRQALTGKNLEKIRTRYNWSRIINQYEELFINVLQNR